ncbi:MAG: (2Fe-2S)-binding protein [Deltaproteobacteria bacterium]|jgi:ferredoxin|nr:(2Fe-2S)-binding protein [Deltaproteobacteria bacterium]
MPVQPDAARADALAATGSRQAAAGRAAPGTPIVDGSIDGMSVSVPRGTTLLAAARLCGIEIPTLCHHDGLPDEGSCRLCMAEIRGQLAVSCMFPLRDAGFAAETRSPAVLAARRYVLSLLVNRAPRAPRILKLAEEYGAAPDPRFMKDPDGCIRCGRCVRACRANGPEAISLAGRGFGRIVCGPFRKPPETCVGCLACALSCPAGKIRFSERGGVRTVWDRDFELAPCPECGERVFTREQIAFCGGGASALCPSCRRRLMASELRKAAAYEAPGGPLLLRSV